MKLHLAILCGSIGMLTPNVAGAEHRSPGMMYTGMAVTGLASATLVSGVAITLYDSNFQKGYLAVLVGLPLIGGSALLAGVGIPLWVVGARSPGGGSAADRELPGVGLVPAVSIGPASYAMRWSF